MVVVRSRPRGVSTAAARAPVALYVHIPFCVSRCPYCDFVLFSGRAARGPANRIDAFVAALLVELELRADAVDEAFGTLRPPLASIYLGGGTPSLLAARQVATILDALERRFGIARDPEITLEANPGRDELGDLRGFRQAGVDRLSIGAQSFDQTELRRLGRRHTSDDVAAAVRSARSAGFSRVGLDLLYDVPGQSAVSWGATLDAALGLEPDHVSAYALALDDPDPEGLTGSAGPAGGLAEGSSVPDHLPVRPGARAWRQRARSEQDQDRAADHYVMADERLTAAGLRWYELSNWARTGAESRHNRVYWRHQPYEALGPGAHAFDGVTRRWNGARLDRYLEALTPVAGRGPRLPPAGMERLDQATLLAERAILALRTREGIDAATARLPAVAPALAWAFEAGLAMRHAGRVVLTMRGRLLGDEVFMRLLPQRPSVAPQLAVAS
jgi:coproporphyrinogen III oxidase-like Fe-S oxidoreductase